MMGKTIADYKKDWETANKAGDKAGMDAAHKAADLLRGYTTDASGTYRTDSGSASKPSASAGGSSETGKSSGGTSSAPQKTTQQSAQDWINDPRSGLGGLGAYTATQNARYADALKTGNKDLVSRLEADAARVGYSLSRPVSDGANAAGQKVSGQTVPAAKGKASYTGSASDISAVQKKLGIAETGVVDKATKDALVKYQKDTKLKINDGTLGDETWGSLFGDKKEEEDENDQNDPVLHYKVNGKDVSRRLSQMTDTEKSMIFSSLPGFGQDSKKQGVGYAYDDEYGMSHVSDTLGTALAYAKNGKVTEYNGNFKGGYATDTEGNRVAVQSGSTTPYGNELDKDGKNVTRYVDQNGQPVNVDIASVLRQYTGAMPSISTSDGRIINGVSNYDAKGNPAPSRPGAPIEKVQGADLSAPQAGGALPPTQSATPYTPDQQAARDWITKQYGSVENYVANQQQRMAEAVKANDTDLIQRLKNDSTRVGYAFDSAQQAPQADSSQGGTTDQAAVRAWISDPKSGYGSLENYVATQQARYDQAMQNPTQNADLINRLKNDAVRVGYQLGGETATIQSEEVPTSIADPWEQKLIDAINDDSFDPQKVYNDIMKEFKNPVTQDEAMSYDEALRIASQQVDPVYNDAMDQRMQEIDQDMLRRGFFGQAPMQSKVVMETAKMENKRAAEKAGLANTLVGQSKQEAYQKAQLSSQERSSKVQALLQALNAAGAIKQNNIANITSYLNYQNSKQSAAAEADYNNRKLEMDAEEKAFQREIDMAKLTGVYQGNPTLDAIKLEYQAKNDEENRQNALRIAQVRKAVTGGGGGGGSKVSVPGSGKDGEVTAGDRNDAEKMIENFNKMITNNKYYLYDFSKTSVDANGNENPHYTTPKQRAEWFGKYWDALQEKANAGVISAWTYNSVMGVVTNSEAYKQALNYNIDTEQANMRANK